MFYKTAGEPDPDPDPEIPSQAVQLIPLENGQGYSTLYMIGHS